MSKISGASNTQKTIMLALAEGWRLRFADHHGWCLFQNGRQRPFAMLAASTVDTMTKRGWLSAGITSREMAFRTEKLLTATGRRYAQKLIESQWAENYEWDPYRVAGTIDPSSTQAQELESDTAGLHKLRLSA